MREIYGIQTRGQSRLRLFGAWVGQNHFLFLEEKYKPDGSFDKFKSRFVAGGHKQNKEEILLEDRNSPIASIPLLMMIASIAAKESRHAKTIDIIGANLNADISQFIRSDCKMIAQLKKAIYGGVESAKLWYDF